MSGARPHLRLRAGGRAFALDLEHVAFVSRIRSDSRMLRLPKRDVPLTSLAWLLGLAQGIASEAVVVEVRDEYQALAVDNADLVDDAGEEEALDLDLLFPLRDVNPEASTPPR